MVDGTLRKGHRRDRQDGLTSTFSIASRASRSSASRKRAGDGRKPRQADGRDAADSGRPTRSFRTRIDIEPEGFPSSSTTAASSRRFWDQPVVMKPLGNRRRQLAAELVRPPSRICSTCGNGADGCRGRTPRRRAAREWVIPEARARATSAATTRGSARAHAAACLARRGRADQPARLAATVGRALLRGLDRDARRRPAVHRPATTAAWQALDKSNGAPALGVRDGRPGVHAAVSTFERNGQQYGGGAIGRQLLPGEPSGGDSVYLFRARRPAGIPSGGKSRGLRAAGAELTQLTALSILVRQLIHHLGRTWSSLDALAFVVGCGPYQYSEPLPHLELADLFHRTRRSGDSAKTRPSRDRSFSRCGLDLVACAPEVGVSSCAMRCTPHVCCCRNHGAEVRAGGNRGGARAGSGLV